MSAHERLQQANPVPDDDRLLAAPGALDAFVEAIRERNMPMGDQPDRSLDVVEDRAAVEVPLDDETPLAQPLRRSRQRGTWMMAAAAAGIATLAVVGLLQLGGVIGAPDEAAPTPTDGVGIVLSTYDALNEGDIDAWIGHFTDGATVFGLAPSGAGDLYGVMAAAGYRVEVIEPCTQNPSTAQGETLVECTIHETDAFHAAGGISLTRQERFLVADDGLIGDAEAQVISFTPPGYFVFNQAFFDWLRDAYPDIHAEIRPQIPTHLPSRPEHMQIALEYLDEFLAQSEVFPVDAGS